MLQAKVHGRKLGLWPRLFTGSVCDDISNEMAYAAFMALYKCKVLHLPIHEQMIHVSDGRCLYGRQTLTRATTVMFLHHTNLDPVLSRHRQPYNLFRQEPYSRHLACQRLLHKNVLFHRVCTDHGKSWKSWNLVKSGIWKMTLGMEKSWKMWKNGLRKLHSTHDNFTIGHQLLSRYLLIISFQFTFTRLLSISDTSSEYCKLDCILLVTGIFCLYLQM